MTEPGTLTYYGSDEMRSFNERLKEMVGQQVLEVMSFSVPGLVTNRYGYVEHGRRYEQRAATIVSVERETIDHDPDPMYWTSREVCRLDNGSVYVRNYSIERWHAEGAHFGSDAIKGVEQTVGDEWLFSSSLYPMGHDHTEQLRRAEIAEQAKRIAGLVTSSKMTEADVSVIESALDQLMHVHTRIER
jgi:hypothetical protein